MTFDQPKFDSESLKSDRAAEPPSVWKVRRDWALAYAAERRRRRMWGSVVGTTLWGLVLAGVYISAANQKVDVADRVEMTVMSAIPLVAIFVAYEQNLDGHGAFSVWALGWLMALGVAADVVYGFGDLGLIWLGVIFAVVAVVAMATLSGCLYIPPDEEFESDVVMPQVVLTALPTPSTSGRSFLGDYHEAEKMAAAWLRRFGYADAEVTPPGHDQGRDVGD